MTLPEAMALQPAWLGIWLNILMVGTFVLPVALLFWKPSRMAGILCLATGVINAALVGFMYSQMGYVKLLSLPHLITWTPLAFYLWTRIRAPQMPVWPARIMVLVLTTILISLAFDYVDVARYILGNRTPLAMPA